MEDSRCSFPALSKSTPEDQTQHESNSECRKYCFCWIFTHVLLGVLLERPNATRGITPGFLGFPACVAPSLLGFSAVLFGESTCGRFQIFRCFTGMFLLLCNLFCASALAGVVCCPGLFSSAIGNLRLNLVDYPRALLNGQTPTYLNSINAARDLGGLLWVQRFFRPDT